ncbi:MAG: hypothetical protein IT270_11600 [Saprospiraceae bacterium]|nr:hypothetical protein [Saprospiraceae bacterium]
MRIVLLLLLLPLISSAQEAPFYERVEGLSARMQRNLEKEFKRMVGEQVSRTTKHADSAVVYVTQPEFEPYTLAITNYLGPGENQLRIMRFLALPDYEAMATMLDKKPADSTLRMVPLFLNNRIFQAFPPKALTHKAPVTIVTGSNHSYNYVDGWVHLSAGGLTTRPDTDLEMLRSYLYERPQPPGETTVLSLLNNDSVNAVFQSVFDDFKTVRTIDHIEKAIHKTQNKRIILVGYVENHLVDGVLLVRYRNNGEYSYKIKAKEMQTVGKSVDKEILLWGVQYADNPEEKIGGDTLREELTRLQKALENEHAGAVMEGVLSDHATVQIESKTVDFQTFLLAQSPRYRWVFLSVTPQTPVALRVAQGYNRFLWLGLLAMLGIVIFAAFKKKRTLLWVVVAAMVLALMVWGVSEGLVWVVERGGEVLLR